MDPIIDKLTTARVGLLLKAPFFGNMATRMRLIEADDWCPTAATNGRDFFYSTKFVEKLSVKKLEFLFAHEICHAVLITLAVLVAVIVCCLTSLRTTLSIRSL